MRVKYLHIDFKPTTLGKIQVADNILMEYEEKGFKMTIRQLYYQMVTRKYSQNSKNAYKSLIETVKNGRMTGLLDWDMLLDESRSRFDYNTWTCLVEFQNEVSAQYQTDRRYAHTAHIEVWAEKYGPAAIISPILKPYQIPIQSTRGYLSTSLLREASIRFNSYGKPVKLIYLGDHDPSGLNMIDDIKNRMGIFAPDMDFELIPLALTMDQVREFDLAPDPAKVTDTRAAKYIEEFGTSSWELDALSPEYIQSIVEAEVQRFVDLDLLNAQIRLDQKDQGTLQQLTQYI